MRRASDEPSLYEVRKGILAPDGCEPRDRPAAARDHDLGPLLDVLEVLAQPIVKRTHAHLVGVSM